MDGLWRNRGGLSDVSMAVSGEHHHQLKAEIATHPLYEQLLSAHVSCLRVATPIGSASLIDAQLSQSHHLLRSYAQNTAHHSLPQHQRQELDNFLAQYLLVLCSFREQLQQHVRVHAVEAVMACREIEQNLQSLTGNTQCLVKILISVPFIWQMLNSSDSYRMQNK
ncbi:Homeobox protein HD1 [Sesamum alatum]|uniref:Homeobox protein HD1 n=1 Tax=Sesamum alatum TaxID=300844 RepID=A0AAE2CV44_9LAMI|nr:Homeobox protein HD1 [Sesamum alatum]